MTMSNAPKIFRFWEGDEFEILLPIDSADFERLTFDAHSIKNVWKPVAVKRVTKNEKGRILVPSDFPGGSVGDMVVGGRAKEKIGGILEHYGELLPLTCDDGEYWTFNVTCLVDALDEAQSDVLRASSGGRVLMIHKHIFKAEALRNVMLFKLPQLRRSTVFVSDSFVKLIKSSGLTGLVFKQIWAPN